MRYVRAAIGLACVLLPLSVIAQDAVIRIQGAPGVPLELPPGVTAPPRDNRPPATGASRLRGRVVAADNGQPLRRAQVRLTAPELRINHSAMTAEDGTFEFRDLAPGRYSLSATRNGYVTLNYGQTRPNEPGRPIELRDNQVLDRVEFSLPRGAVIAGRILDEFGEPVAGVAVQPLQYRFLNGQRQLTPAGTSGRTLDTGEFRIWGLMPGEYTLSATAAGGGPLLEQVQSDDRIAYGVTFYPGTLNSAQAQFVKLNVGQTLNEVSIVLNPVRTASVSGSAIDSEGRPARGNLSITQRRAGAPIGGMTAMMSGASNLIGADGRFVFRNLVPGEYTITATASPAGPGVQPESLSATVTIDGTDVTDVVLMPVRQATFSGRIVSAGGQLPLSSDIRVTAQPRTLGTGPIIIGGGPGQPAVREDYTFQITANPGELNLRATVSGASWAVKAIRRGGVDITDETLVASNGEVIENLEIELTNRVQDVSGVVADSRGQLQPDYTVVFFARDTSRRQEPTRYFGVGRPDQEGRYRIRTLPPGEYLAIAVEYFDATQRGDLDLLRELERGATSVTIAEGETKAVNLTLAPNR